MHSQFTFEDLRGPRPQLLLVGSGETELGHADQQRKPVNLKHSVIPALTLRILGLDQKIDSPDYWPFDIKGIRKWHEIQIAPPDQKPRSFAKIQQEGRAGTPLRTQRVLTLARTIGCDACIIVIDCETWENRRLRHGLVQGRTDYRKRALGGADIACAIGTPCRSMETWLLADECAVNQVFRNPNTTIFSGNPETRPSPQKLKQRLGQLSQEAHLDYRDARAQLARCTSPSTLERRCPVSYRPFVTDVESEIRPLVSVTREGD